MHAVVRELDSKQPATKQRPRTVRAKLTIVKPNNAPTPVDIEHIALTALLAHLSARGFAPLSIFNGVDVVPFTTNARAIDLLLAAEQSTLMVQAEHGNPHGIFIVPGNGADIVGAWAFDDGDADHFNAAMIEFDRVACG
ncbi:hypothetical protein FHW12_000368 [Dokdonella fugitiva]|uniref:Uncharacterized protein n=1 Tax=Dokdonella fugitiva TaxID=328517 RepID=A0A839EPE8_9GAMM|nr:hypothetical protein [Dokdonella fugitiva]MBA8886177.1 hypothetical protein [Dokdonella fugitiva]